MEITAQYLAELLGGEIQGDPKTVVTGPARIEQARKGDVCFFANPKYEHYIYDTRASVLLINKDFQPKAPIPATVIRVDDAYRAVSVLLDFYARLRRTRKRGNRFWARLSFRRSVACSARIGKGTYIYPQVYVGPNVKIGSDCILYPGVRIYHDCEIGDEHIREVQPKELSQIAIETLNSLNKLTQVKDRLLEIVEDGVISEDEYEDFHSIKMNLEKIAGAVESLQLWLNESAVNGKVDMEKLSR